MTWYNNHLLKSKLLDTMDNMLDHNIGYMFLYIWLSISIFFIACQMHSSLEINVDLDDWKIACKNSIVLLNCLASDQMLL